MGLFKEAKNESAFLKMGFYGPNKSGKTFTAALVAIGLYKLIKAKKPVGFVDSETGSDYVSPKFKAEGVPLRTIKTRSFETLAEAIPEAEKECSILIVDSVSHYWDDTMDTYMKEKGVSRIVGPLPWMAIKGVWRKGFATPFVHSSLHIIICGRQGDVWEDEIDEEGNKELKRTGTKMRTEKELGYEPSLLVEMSIKRDVTMKKMIHRAFVEGDRFDIMTFNQFDDPTFEDFLPHIKALNLGGDHRAFDQGEGSGKVFATDNSEYAHAKRRKILLDEILEEIKYRYPGQSAEDKKSRAELMMELFETKSWPKVEEVKDEAQLMNALATLKGTNGKQKEEAVMVDGEPAPF